MAYYSEAAAGCEVLPTVAGRCVEIPGRMQALHLAATSCRRTVSVAGFLLFEVTLRDLRASSRNRRVLEVPVTVPVLQHLVLSSGPAATQ